jgi:hypothetical protein
VDIHQTFTLKIQNLQRIYRISMNTCFRGNICSCCGVLKGFNLPQRALRFRRTLGCSKIVYRLQIQPELRGAAEVAREPQGGIGSDTAALQNDVTNARRARSDE